jgi:hypothetical protein
MNISMPRGPIVGVGVVAYGLVSFSMPMGMILKPTLGEVADVVSMLGFLWPYPLLLSLQSLLPAQGVGAFLAIGVIVLLGLGVVWWFTSYVQERLGYDKWSNPRAYVWAPWLWFLPLVALQAAVYGLAFLVGLPVGE